MLRKGFLHRDISIGNVLMLDPPVVMEPFAEWTIEQRVAQLHLQDRTTELGKYVDLVKMIKETGSPNQCCGFVIDGDMAARLEDCFTLCDAEEISVGTPNYVGKPS